MIDEEKRLSAVLLGAMLLLVACAHQPPAPPRESAPPLRVMAQGPTISLQRPNISCPQNAMCGVAPTPMPCTEPEPSDHLGPGLCVIERYTDDTPARVRLYHRPPGVYCDDLDSKHLSTVADARRTLFCYGTYVMSARGTR